MTEVSNDISHFTKLFRSQILAFLAGYLFEEYFVAIIHIFRHRYLSIKDNRD